MFSPGTHAIAICDRCGQQVPHRELRVDIVNSVKTGLLVCEDCDDHDHPQYQVGKYFVAENTALQDPRPDKSDDASRALWSWRPVSSFGAVTALGSVTVR